MKTAGIILIVFGGISTLGGIIGTMLGGRPNFAGLTFVVLGAFLISRSVKKKEEEEKKKKWEQETTNEN